MKWPEKGDNFHTIGRIEPLIPCPDDLLPCPTCDGTGELTCSACSGTGSATIEGRRACYRCGGAGSVPCPECEE